MIRAIRNRLKAFKTFRAKAQFLNIAAQYERDAREHHGLATFHQEAETHARRMAKAARDTARSLK